MPRRVIVAALLLVVLLAPSRGRAENMLVVENGQTLGKIARRSGCSIEELQRANALRGSLIYAGQKLVVPQCATAKPSKDRASRGKKTGNAEIAERAVNPEDYDLSPVGKVNGRRGQSIGKPWDGQLKNAVKLPDGKGYFIRHRERVYGTTHVITQVQRAIRAVRNRFPRVHAVAIGDVSNLHGGEIPGHHSHQSGRDVDVGLYFKKRPEGYPEEFVDHESAPLDLAATWALVYAFARTAGVSNGVQAIFLDYQLQKRLYVWARDHGVPENLLDEVFEYPEPGGTGIVRHEPNHGDHLHVRFKCADGDGGCER